MKKWAYYNDTDPYVCEWVRSLIAKGLIPNGYVDCRSIRDVQPEDVKDFVQCHWFCGIAGWALAARLAGWPDDREIWTGSPPCQPFSVAGKQRGQDDDRHLWPHMLRLIAARRPAVWFGEQVAAAARAKDARQDLQRMRRAQALQRVLRGQQGPHADKLLRMLESDGAVQEGWYDLAAVGVPCGMEEEESSTSTCRGSEASRFAERLGVRLGSMDSAFGGEIRARGLRDDRTPVEHGRRKDVGQSVTRQDQPGGWLHDNERPRSSVCPQRDDEHMGRGESLGSCGRAAGEDAGGGSSPAGGMGGELEAEAKSAWLDGVLADLEGIGYAGRAAVVPACAVDAPHRRDRLWIVAERAGAGLEGLAGNDNDSTGWAQQDRPVAEAGSGGDVAEPGCAGHDGAHRDASEPRGDRQDDRVLVGGSSELRSGAMADTDGIGRQVDPNAGGREAGSGAGQVAGLGSAWHGAGWVIGHDRKARRVPEPSIRLLADGLSARVGRLRAYGNAIVPALAAEVIGAYLDCMPVTA